MNTGNIKVYYGSSTLTTTSAPIDVNSTTKKYHIVVTASKTFSNVLKGYFKIYVNGEEIISSSLITLPTTYLPGDLFIGNSGDTVTPKTFNGYLAELAIFPYSLTDEEIVYMYEIATAIKQEVYPSLYGHDTDIWGSMLEIATADLGMFYFDENNNFIYEDNQRLQDTKYNRHTVSQYSLIDDKNIISARQDFSLVANSISCKIYKNIIEMLYTPCHFNSSYV